MDHHHDAMAEPDPKRRKTSASSTQKRKATHHFDKVDCVTLIVGSGRHEMLVHVNYLAQESEYFNNALANQWHEITTNFHDIDYETMTNYITFAYIEKLPTAHLVGPICETFTGEEHTSLARLYVLGVRFINQSLQRAALAEIKQISTLLDIDATATFPGPEDIDIIYKETREGDPARRLMVVMLAENASVHWLVPECNQTFVLDLARELLGRSRGHPLLAPSRFV